MLFKDKHYSLPVWKGSYEKKFYKIVTRPFSNDSFATTCNIKKKTFQHLKLLGENSCFVSTFSIFLQKNSI